MHTRPEKAAATAHSAENRLGVALAAGVICVSALAAYHATLWAPFHYDDLQSIENNPTIRNLATALRPLVSTTARGRPVLNFSFAVNYAVGGTEVWGYHAANLAIHIFSGLALFGIVRRTLALRAVSSPSLIAASVAALWTLHPIQTEAVSYVVQRAESLMGLFYLLTLYCFIRGVETRPALWFSVSVVCCLLGMATKEVMASAPLVVFLYDRTFVSGSFREALRRRWRVFASLAATWLILAFLVYWAYGPRNAAGSGAGAAWWNYALTQLRAITHYIRLCFWPHPLIFDYGTALVPVSPSLLPFALFVLSLAGATVWALVRRPAAGFLGTAFFLILAPSSSIMPVAGETMAEYRMYLPSIAIITLVVVEVYRNWGRSAVALCAVLAAAMLAATWKRNEVYLSDESLWADTVAKLPGNFRAQTNLGEILANIPGRRPEAIAHLETAVRIEPRFAKAQNNLGSALAEIPSRLPEAIVHLEAAAKLNPGSAEAENNLGVALSRVPGRMQDAIFHYEAALKINPGYAKAHNNLGAALETTGAHSDEAIRHFEDALRIEPAYAEAHSNLGNALTRVPGRLPEAIAHLNVALKIDPYNAEAQNRLGAALVSVPGRLADAMSHFETAIRINPDLAEAHFNLGYVLLKTGGHESEARDQFEYALRLRPDWEPLVARFLTPRLP